MGLLQERVDRRADSQPEHVALVSGSQRMTYGELSAVSNQLARMLKEGGCERGDRVCFLMPKSPAAIVAMLGVLKADCVYVPMDPASPPARLARVIRSSEPRWMLAAGPVASVLYELLAGLNGQVRVGWMDTATPRPITVTPVFTAADLDSCDSGPLDYTSDPHDPAHLLFTSGSTGQPKGVVITHAMVTAFLDWAIPYFGITDTDRTSGHSPLHFDLSTFDVYGSLAAGAELHLVAPELNLIPQRLANFIRTSELTQWFSVPSILAFMASQDVVTQDDFPFLKRLLWCGEVFPTPPLIYWMKRLPKVSFTNLYGPTEATIASSYYTLRAVPQSEKQAIPVGRPCDGEELLILDAEMREVPVGETGDLYIGGAGLSPGYWRAPDLTAAAFRAHPEDPGRRIYRTGDLAAMDQHQLVYFHGRADSQIKSRGYRIELGEIETALNAMPELSECAVVAIETDAFEGSTICCAFVPANGATLSSAALRTALAKLVPGYMLPTRWLQAEALPKNVNGKTDRPALRARFETQA